MLHICPLVVIFFHYYPCDPCTISWKMICTIFIYLFFFNCFAQLCRGWAKNNPGSCLFVYRIVFLIQNYTIIRVLSVMCYVYHLCGWWMLYNIVLVCGVYKCYIVIYDTRMPICHHICSFYSERTFCRSTGVYTVVNIVTCSVVSRKTKFV